MSMIAAALLLWAVGATATLIWRRGADEWEGWWMVTLAASLLLIGEATPNGWLRALAWSLAAHPWWVLLGVRAGIVAVAAPPREMVRFLWPVTLFLGAHALLVRHGVPPRAVAAVAAGLAGWAALNVAIAWMEYGRMPLPRVIVRRDPGAPVEGLVGSGPMLAWLVVVGTLSCWYLSRAVTPWALSGALALLPILAVTRHFTAPAAGLVAAGVAWGGGPGLAAGVGGAGLLAAWHLQRGGASLAVRREVFRDGWRVARASWCWGCGLGLWGLLRYQRAAEVGRSDQYWIRMHNDWLQALVEVGALPVALAAGYVLTALAGPLRTPEARYGASLLAFTAVQALVYFPLRLPGQVMPLLLATVLLEPGAVP